MFQNIFSSACRDKCMAKLRSLVPVPTHSGGGKVPENTSSLMVPLCQVEGVPSLLYTVRSSNICVNTGLITFPGGNIINGETAEQAALRELHEDLGLVTDKLNIWGHGPTFPCHSNKLLIVPVIGVIRDFKASDLIINTNKVSEVFAIPLQYLCDPKNQFYTHFTNGCILPVFMTENYKIWGMTAYITHVFLASALSKDVYGNDWLRKKLEKSVY